ncbi:type I restriction endonuclease [Qingrenia yutianensis]|uniref:Type I restriction enzyme HsdR N-terminal domain-containing protein n=1 Tax=Qingrenia yutianensis TaxID=2763676 RepID=A0A926FB14_9FIRM|nr:type I restriction endonuclease [Qingrenia yutianensis]MBC8597215.1 type I restriction enzyme HsdR N-terminal domain-containing protein [Qingrenia yutianensis]
MFEEKIKSFIGRIEDLKENIKTEEATKTSLIMPFFSMLGYDVFNPMEFVPEYIADVGIKKGEKVDYAIILDNEPTILIEAKSITETLDKHDSQLFRYFGTSNAKFAILTNGVIYKFYTDLEETNKMDTTPFLTVDLLNLRDSDIAELKKFSKENFDKNNILNSASELKYCGLIKAFLKREFTTPSDEFTRLILSSDIYEGRLLQNVVDKFKPLVKKSISAYINEIVNDKIKTALNSETPAEEETEEITGIEPADEIITTAEELQSFYIIKSILGNDIELNRITYKDTVSYFSVLIDNKVTRWVCRIYLKEHTKYLIIPNGDKQEKYNIDKISDIYNLSEQLKTRASALV